MYLKRLELQGFKSFHGRTLFEFGSGITAIVGPNGTGKSNVAESIRWVLGEQGARSLRARRLEDVIFSGSSQRAAVGMAEVAMVLDNAEGWLPVDFSEVVVSRRAYRNGDSEYLINKAKVRLRDVLDLFRRAHVGQNSYAFMGQGLVEEVLLMRPEERRRLLEEAADVKLLRTRLDEARDRLAATRENLERVNLLIDEIAPRLRQLEGQAQRAARGSDLSRQLADALRALYGQLWLDGGEALTAARATAEQRQRELDAAQQEARACDEGVAALSTAVEEQERQLVERRVRRRTLDDQTHGLEQRLSFDAERVAANDRRRQETESEIESLRGERADLQHSLTALRERESSIPPEIEAAKALIGTRRDELNTLDKEQSALRRRAAETDERSERERRAATEAEAALARIAADANRIQGEGVRRDARRIDLLTALRGVGREFKAIRDDFAALDREIASAENERNGLFMRLEGGRAAVQKLEIENPELNDEVSQVRGRLELLMKLQRSAAGMDAGGRYLLGGSDDDQERRQAVEGLLGLARDTIRVPPGLERAIEAGLAESVEALVFENMATAVAAIELLEQRGAGRALIYPLDAVRSVPPLNLLRERGIVGVAARLVRVDNRFRTLIDALLGRVIVVEGVALAQQVLRRGLGSVVTTDGVLLRPNGAISGGLSAETAAAFSRQRELEALPERLARLEAEQRDVANRLRRERETLAAAQTSLGQIEPRLQALRDERATVHSGLIENRGRLILLRGQGRLDWQEVRQEIPQRDLRGRTESLRAEQSAHEEVAQRLTEALQRDAEALAVLTGRRNAGVDALTDASAAEANLEGEARSLVRQAELLETALRRVEAQLQSREEQLRALLTERQALEARGVEAQTELAALNEELALLVAEMEPAESELQHLAGRERSLREQLSAARKRLLAGERAFLEADAAVKLRGEEIEALRDHLAAEGFVADGDDVVPAGGAAFERRGGPPAVRGGAPIDIEAMRAQIAELRRQVGNLGPVNEQAATDFDENKQRYDFLRGQVDDLEGARETLMSGINELESNIRERLKSTFSVVDREFQRYFEAFFDGGKARLVATHPEDFANSGIDISAQPPGKRVSSLAMLSGGERALTALALLLSLLEAHPSPICVLDEVDAALDEANIGRFVAALKDLAKKTQFIIITHNPRTVEASDVIYGISMAADNTSKVLSLRLGDAPPGTLG